MSNTFYTSELVAKMAALSLQNRLIAGQYSNRSLETLFADKVGDTIKVSTPPVLTVNEFSGTTTPQNIAETSVNVTLQKHGEVTVYLTTKDLTLEMKDFNYTIVEPAMKAISQKINTYFLAKLRGGFARNVAGSIANRPSTLLHIAAGHKVLDDNFIDNTNRVGIVDTTVKGSFLSLAQFTSKDYGDRNAASVQNYEIGSNYGARWVVDPSAGVFDRGDIAGSVLATGTAGASTIALAALTTAAGVIKEGTAFTINGNSTRYVVTADTASAANAVAALPIYPVLAANAAGAAVSFEAAGYTNIIYDPNSIALAIVAPQSLNTNKSYTFTMNGMSVRVTMDFSISNLATAVTFDCLYGAKVTHSDAGVVLAG